MSSPSRRFNRGGWIITLAVLLSAGSAAADDSAAVQQLLDRAAIKNVLARYTHALDTHDAEKFASVFTIDAVFEVGENVIRRGRAQIRGIVLDMIENDATAPARGLEVATAMHHVMTNSELEVFAGGEARHTAYWMTVLGNADGQYGVVAMGRYEDVLVKHRGQWRIRSRKLLR